MYIYRRIYLAFFRESSENVEISDPKAGRLPDKSRSPAQISDVVHV
jgi:hypothetical protein